MAKINLRDIFPFYTTDCFVEVPDGEEEAFASCITQTIADVFVEFYRAEVAYLRRLFRNNANYSLDQNDGIEKSIISAPSVPQISSIFEEFEPNVTNLQLYEAIDSLPHKQAKRIYAHYFLSMSKKDIARAENVHESSVRESIDAGLKNIKKFLEKSLHPTPDECHD